MSMKVEQASTVESHRVQTTVTGVSSAASSTPKISMFAAKSGFVIPKNKLSGSLVPIFRGSKKLGGSDAVNDESTKQVQRKTKWGPDLTQDAVVRKGRALAYQTRVDQIIQQLKSGILETGDNQESLLAVQIPDHESSGHQINSEKSELLELERREAIGEILKLNPSYKVPPDYKPLLKEAKVPIPIKEYPGYNFIGLIFGSASDTQKRLEKETGAKIQVYGTKADTGEKGEITPSDGNEIHGAYEELYIHVSADTYEKVDAAISLIELLVTPVSVNPAAASTTSTSVSGENVNVINQSQETSTPYKIPSVGVNQGGAQPVVASAQTPAQGQFQLYPGSWFPIGRPQTPIHPPSGFLPPNPSAPILNNPVQVSSAPFNRSNMPSLFGPRPLLAAGFASVPQNPSFVPSRPQLPVLQRPYMLQVPPFGHTALPRNAHVPALQPPPAQPNISAPPPFPGNQVTPTGPPPIVRPLMHTMPQPLSRPPSGPLPDRSLAPAGNSTQWSQRLAGTPPSLGPGNMAVMAPPMVPPQGQHPVASQPIPVSGALLSNISAANMAFPVTFPSRPSAPESSGTAANCPIAALAFTSVPQPLVGLSPASSSSLPLAQVPAPAPIPFQSSLVSPLRPVIGRAAVPNASLNPVLGSTPVPSSLASTSTLPAPLQSGIPSSVSGSAPNFTHIKPPPITAPKPQHPSSSDFTFQPHRPQNPVSQAVPRPGSQPMLPPKQMVQPPLAPQTPSFRPAMHSPNPQPVMQGFPRPQLNNQMNQPQAQLSVPFAGNPTPLRHAAFPNPSPVAPNPPVPQIGPGNFSPAPQMANSACPFPLRLGNPMLLQQTYPAATARPQNLLAPNQQFSTNLSTSGKPVSSPSGAQQIYDPFSPTSASLVPQQGGIPAKVRKQESDPEYEDLMASVGVK
uniref:Putative extensin n=1 Tax=Davidia involucrata TaxID=16924 RepID=A0A5B6ZQT4_DAVIN